VWRSIPEDGSGGFGWVCPCSFGRVARALRRRSWRGGPLDGVVGRILRWVFLVATAGTGAVLLAAGVLLGDGGGGAEAAGYETFTIDILPDGFNPPYCLVNRTSTDVYFRNKDTQPRRVVSDAAHGLDTGWIDPGKTNSGWHFDHYDIVNYHDYEDPSLMGVVASTFSQDAPSNCAPWTPTPTKTATPTATVSPTAPSRPEACKGVMQVSRLPVKGCAVAPDLNSEGQEDDSAEP
jgi:hypothetical protein